jgi:hypothetical protein
MNVFARSLALLAVAAHIGVTISDAVAKPGGPSGGAGGGHGAVSGHSVSGQTGVNGGRVGVNGYGVNGFGVSGFGVSNGYGQGRSARASTPSTDAGYPFSMFGFTAEADACGADLQLFDPGDFVDPVERVAEISQQTQNDITFYGCNTQTQIADALDRYASALEQIDEPPPPEPGLAPPPRHRLPREMRDLPRIVREAAARVRAAPSPHAAIKVLQAAIDVVEKKTDKTIALMRASDPDANSFATRGGDLVADTLKSAQTALARSDSL